MASIPASAPATPIRPAATASGPNWLEVLTSHAFPASFYVGDALGSFNSLMRLITGVLAGFGLAWFAFPYMEASLAES